MNFQKIINIIKVLLMILLALISSIIKCLLFSIIAFFYLLSLFFDKSYTHEIYPKNTNERIVLNVHYTGDVISGNTDFTINVYDKKNNLLITYENFNATSGLIYYKIYEDTLFIISVNDFILKRINNERTTTKFVFSNSWFLETELDSLNKIGFKVFPIDTASEKIRINL